MSVYWHFLFHLPTLILSIGSLVLVVLNTTGADGHLIISMRNASTTLLHMALARLLGNVAKMRAMDVVTQTVLLIVLVLFIILLVVVVMVEEHQRVLLIVVLVGNVSRVQLSISLMLILFPIMSSRHHIHFPRTFLLVSSVMQKKLQVLPMLMRQNVNMPVISVMFEIL